VIDDLALNEPLEGLLGDEVNERILIGRLSLSERLATD
jgi:hypothetical protein